MNPYATLQNPAYDITSEHPDHRSLPILSNLVTTWEKLRVIYNLTLAVPGILILIQASQKNHLPTSELITSTILFALAANTCFFAGPLIELYLCALSQRPPRKKIRLALTIAGFTLSIIVVLWIGLTILPSYNATAF